MRRKITLTAVVAALAGSLFTWQMADHSPAPHYVFAQDQQYVSLTFAPIVRKTLPAVVTVEIRSPSITLPGSPVSPSLSLDCRSLVPSAEARARVCVSRESVRSVRLWFLRWQPLPRHSFKSDRSHVVL